MPKLITQSEYLSGKQSQMHQLDVAVHEANALREEIDNLKHAKEFASLQNEVTP